MEQPDLYDLTEFKQWLDGRIRDTYPHTGSHTAFQAVKQQLDSLKPTPTEYGVWRRPRTGLRQVFCPRCDGKESCDRPFCPRCGLNMRPPEGVRPTYA